jgi:multiple sugar transport system permease protein
MGLRQQRRIKMIGVYTILLAWTLWLAFPLYWLVIAAFKTPLAQSQHATYVPFMDFQPTLNAWVNVFGQSGGLDPRTPFTNSVMIACSAGIIALVVGSMAGYALARFNYRIGAIDNDRISTFLVSQRMFPVAVLAVPFLILYRELNLLDTQIGMVVAEIGFGTPFVAWLIRDFFASLPREVEDSALIDGCNRLQVLRYIAFPLGAPGLVAAFILVFIGAWNNYFLALVLTFSNAITVPLFIQTQAQYVTGITPWANIAVITLVSILPPVIAGLLLQRYLTHGLTFGAVK